MTDKKCGTCKIQKDLSEFHNKKVSKDGKMSKCKTCEKMYKANRKQEYSKSQRDYHKANREGILKRKRKYYAENKKVLNSKAAKRNKVKRKIDFLYKLKGNIRNLIGNSIRNKGFFKKSKTATILGCSFEQLHNHLRLSFESNYGIPFNHIDTTMLHIDHIIPLVTAKTEEEVLKLNHYSNLQYLFAEDNLKKGSSIFY